jgi:hypothetical protein
MSQRSPNKLPLSASNLASLNSLNSSLQPGSPIRSIEVPQHFDYIYGLIKDDNELMPALQFWEYLIKYQRHSRILSNIIEHITNLRNKTDFKSDEYNEELKRFYNTWKVNGYKYVPPSRQYSDASSEVPSEVASSGLPPGSQFILGTEQGKRNQQALANAKKSRVLTSARNFFMGSLNQANKKKKTGYNETASNQQRNNDMGIVLKRSKIGKLKSIQTNLDQYIDNWDDDDNELATAPMVIKEYKLNFDDLSQQQKNEITKNNNENNLSLLIFNDKYTISVRDELTPFEEMSTPDDIQSFIAHNNIKDMFKNIFYYIYIVESEKKKDGESITDEIIKKIINHTKIKYNDSEIDDTISVLFASSIGEFTDLDRTEVINIINKEYLTSQNKGTKAILFPVTEKEETNDNNKILGTTVDTSNVDTSRPRSSSVSLFTNIEKKPSMSSSTPFMVGFPGSHDVPRPSTVDNTMLISIEQEDDNLTKENIEDFFLAFDDDDDSKYIELDKGQENEAVASAVDYYIEEQFTEHGDVIDENKTTDDLIADYRKGIETFINNRDNNIINIIKESIKEARRTEPSTDLGGSINNTKIVGGDTKLAKLEEEAFGPYIEQTIAVLNGDIAKETIIDVNDYDDLDNDDDENKTPLIDDERSLINIIDSKDNDIFKSTEDKYTLEDEPQLEETDKFNSLTDQKDEFKENIKKNIQTIIEETHSDLQEDSEYNPDTTEITETTKDNTNLINKSYIKTLEKINNRMKAFKTAHEASGSVRSSTTGALTRSAQEKDRGYKVVHNIASSYLSNVLNNSNLSLDEINTAGSTSRSDGRNALVQSVFSHMLGGANIKFNGGKFREDMARASTGVRSLGADNRQQMINCWGKRVTYITERSYDDFNAFLSSNQNKITSAKDKNIFKITFATHQISNLKPRCYICGCNITEKHFPEVEHKLPCVGFYSQIYNIAAYPNLKKYWISFIDNTKYDKYGLFTMLVKLYKYMHIQFIEEKITKYFASIFSLFEKYLKKNTKFYVIGNANRNEKDLDHFKLILLPYLSEFTWSHHTCNQIKTNYDLITDENKFKPQMKNLLEGKSFKGAVIKKNMIEKESDVIKTINFDQFNKRYSDNLIPQITYLNNKITEFAGIQELTRKRLFIRTLKRIYITQKNDNKKAVQASKNRANFQMKLIKKTVVELKKMVAEACHKIVNFDKYSLQDGTSSSRSGSSNIPLNQIIKNNLLLPFLYIFKGDAFGKVYDNNGELIDATNNGCIKEGIVLLNKTIDILNKTAGKRIEDNKKI